MDQPFLSGLNISSDAWAAVFGAILGSIVGGLISYLIQKKILADTKKERDSERLELRKSLAHLLIVKAIRLQSNLFQLSLHMEECFALIDKTTRPSFVMKPLVNLPDRVYFSDDEIGLVLSMNNDNITNIITSLDHVHNSKLDAFDKMMTFRSELESLLPSPESIGAQGRSEIKLSPEKSKELEPKIRILDDLILDIRNDLKRDFKEALDLTSNLVQTFNKNLGMKLKLEVKTDLMEKLNAAVEEDHHLK